LTPAGRDTVLRDLHALASRNVQEVTAAYVSQRLDRYNYVVTARQRPDGRLLGFGLAKLSAAKFRPYLPARLMHLGLMVIDSNVQGRHVSRSMGEALFWNMWRRAPLSVSVFGVFCSGKCSSPASYMAFQRKSRGFCFPEIVLHDGEPSLRHSALADSAATRFRRFLDLKGSGFVLKGINRDGSFVLGRKDFTFIGDDRPILAYFESEIFPDSELLTIIWYHPLMSLWR